MDPNNGLAVTPYVAAIRGVGANRVARIERFKLDGTRCGMVQGRHAEWNWAYRVYIDGIEKPLRGDRSLVEARTIAACGAARIVEAWEGGKTWIRGPKGGLSNRSTCPARYSTCVGPDLEVVDRRAQFRCHACCRTRETRSVAAEVAK